jgi:hypothetical protein
MKDYQFNLIMAMLNVVNANLLDEKYAYAKLISFILASIFLLLAI